MAVYLFALWQRFSDRLLPEWKTVTRDEARSNPYFGFKGWLLLFYLMTIYSLVGPEIDWILGMNQAVPDTPSYQLSADMSFGGSLNAYWTHRAINTAVLLPFLILAPLKHPLTPKIGIAATWIGLAASFALIKMPGQMNTMIIGAISGVVVSALLTWYILASKRVNVTFLNRVPANQSGLIQNELTKKTRRLNQWATIFWIVIIAFVGLFLLQYV
jgi:hypothetical protein